MDTIMRLSLLVRLRDGFSGAAAGVIRRLHDIGEAAKEATTLSQLGKNMMDFGGRVSQVGAQGRSMVAGFIQPFTEVQDEAAKLQTVWVPVAGTIEESMASAVASARRWSEAHRNSMAEYLGTAYEMAGAGLKSTEAIKGTEAALKLATATFGTGAEAANLLAVLYNNMGNKAADVGDEMQRLGDIVAVTQGVFQIKNLAQLRDGLTYAIPAAQQFGIALEEAMTAVGQLNSAGLQGSQAGTSYEAALGQFERASKKLGFGIERTKTGSIDLIRTLARMRVQFGDTLDPRMADKFRDAFGQEGARGITLLLPKVDELRKNLKAVGKDAGGAMDRALKPLEATLASRAATLKNKFSNMLVDFGEKALPAIERLLPKLESLLKWVVEFVDKHPDMAAFAATMFVFGSAALSVVAPLFSLGGAMLAMLAYARMAKAALGGVGAAATAAGEASAAAAGQMGARGAAAAGAGLGLGAAIPIIGAAYVGAKTFEAMTEQLGPQDQVDAAASAATGRDMYQRTGTGDPLEDMARRQKAHLYAKLTNRQVAQMYSTTEDVRRGGGDAAYSTLLDRGVPLSQLRALTEAVNSREAVPWMDLSGKRAAEQQIHDIVIHLDNQTAKSALPQPGALREDPTAPSRTEAPTLGRVLDPRPTERATVYHVGSINVQSANDPAELARLIAQQTREKG